MLKVVAVVVALTLPASAGAAGLEEWRSNGDTWRAAYLDAVTDWVTTFVQPDEPPPYKITNGYRACLHKRFSYKTLMTLVDSYIQRNPSTATENLFPTVAGALAEVCANYIR